MLWVFLWLAEFHHHHHHECTFSKPKIEPLGFGVQDNCNHVGAPFQKEKEKGVTTTHYITLVYVRVKWLKKLTVMCVAAPERQKSLQRAPFRLCSTTTTYYYTPTKLLTSDNSWDLFSRRFVSVAAERSWRVRLCSTTTTTHQQYKQNYWLLTTLEISSLAVSCLLQQSVHGRLNLNDWVYIYIYIYIYIFTEQLLNAHHPSLSTLS